MSQDLIDHNRLPHLPFILFLICIRGIGRVNKGRYSDVLALNIHRVSEKDIYLMHFLYTKYTRDTISMNCTLFLLNISDNYLIFLYQRYKHTHPL